MYLNKRLVAYGAVITIAASVFAGGSTYFITGFFNTYRNPSSWVVAIDSQKQEKIRQLDSILAQEKAERREYAERRAYAAVRALHQFTGSRSLVDYLNPFSPGFFVERQINDAYNKRLNTRKFAISITQDYYSIFKGNSRNPERIKDELRALELRVISEIKKWREVFQDPRIQVEDVALIKSGVQEGRLRVSGAIAFVTTVLGSILTYLSHEFTKPISKSNEQKEHFDIFQAFEEDRDYLR